MNNKYKILSALLLFSLLNGCRKKSEPEPAEEKSTGESVITGSIHGKVFSFLYDSSVVHQATVYIPGSNFNTVTDTNGSYVLTNLNPGTYDIAVITPQNRKTQVQNITVSSNTSQNIDLYTVPEFFFVFNGTIKKSQNFAGNNILGIRSPNRDEAMPGGFVWILSDSLGVDPVDVKTFDYSLRDWMPPTCYSELNLDKIKSLYPSGTKVFVSIYNYDYFNKHSSYVDVQKQLPVVVGASRVMPGNFSFIWP